MQKNDNFPFLKKLVETVKQAVDAIDPFNDTINERMYVYFNVSHLLYCTSDHTHTILRCSLLPHGKTLTQKAQHWVSGEYNFSYDLYLCSGTLSVI